MEILKVIGAYLLLGSLVLIVGLIVAPLITIGVVLMNAYFTPVGAVIVVGLALLALVGWKKSAF